MSDSALTVEGRRVALTNADKVLFPEAGLTKADLADYYRRIGPTALPHYRDRPLSMHRFPDGIAAEGFFQKHRPDYFPDWIERAVMAKKDGTVEHVVAGDVATLVYLASQGCITPHLALARRDRPDHPDRLVLDLDPSDDDFAKVRRAALAAKELLDAVGLASFVQTTGSRGLHVVVPIDRAQDFDAVRPFVRRICQCLVDRHPDELTIEQRKAERGDRVFLDYLRNAYGQTAVGPYAVRPLEGAPVATPLEWHEVADAALDPRKFHIGNVFRRLGQIEDPWRSLPAYARPLAEPERRLARLTGG